MTTGRSGSVTPRARPVDLSAAWNASDADVAARFHPVYRQALERLPDGPSIFRGVPFSLGSRTAACRWILVGDGLAVDLRGHGRASHLLVAHFSDSWRDQAGERSSGTPVGWVLPTGEPLVRYEIRYADGTAQVVDVRRRFEIADGIIGWGFVPFAAVGHRADEPLDWRGPMPRQEAGRYAPAGHAGPLTMLPGTWAAAQTGVADFVPTLDDDATLWLHAILLESEAEATQIRLERIGARRPGTDVVVGGLTFFDGTADPFVLTPRRQFLVEGVGGGEAQPSVDLGVVIRSRPARSSGAQSGDESGETPIGWGRPFAEAAAETSPATASIIDLAVAPDAILSIGHSSFAMADLAMANSTLDGRMSIRQLPGAEIRLDVRVLAGGQATAARVRFVAEDDRYLPPLGHRDEVNPGIFEDTGAGLVLGSETFAYVPGEFQIDVPPGSVAVEVVKGFDHRPVRRSIVVGPTTSDLEIALDRPIDLRAAGWHSSDSHVHFLAPSTALLQAAAEDVAFVHLLATQLGDHFISVTDLPWGSVSDLSGGHAVIVGTENRQNMLGHLALLGARNPILPLAAGGAPEGRIGQAVTELLGDWADRCHAAGGLVVGAHFPLPYSEIAADIVSGRIDAIEMQCFAPGLDNPSILEWYRFLNCGYRLPVLGGTDKMSAEVPVGAVRTYAHLDPEVPVTFEAWSAAVRAGRTFATSGPVLELAVDGQEPGAVISLPGSGGHLEVQARARAAQPLIRAVELVVNGRVVAHETSPRPTEDLRLSTTIQVEAGAWIAARSLSDHEIHSAFRTSMAAHTSPVYIEVTDRPLFIADDAEAIVEVIDGTVRWLETMAAIEVPAVRARMAAQIAASGATLRGRLGQRAGGFPT